METDLNRKPDLEPERHQSPGAEAVAERSKGLFDSGMHCAESVLQAVAEAYGVIDPLIPKIATGFCGGISRTSGMCGALAGGIMALGLLTGRSSPQDSRNCCYALTHNLVQRFRERFGSTQCTELLGCDISTADGAASFKANGLEKTVCGPVTRQAAGFAGRGLCGTRHHPPPPPLTAAGRPLSPDSTHACGTDCMLDNVKATNGYYCSSIRICRQAPVG